MFTDAAPEYDLPPATRSCRYIVCSMQRTGSSLLCAALRDTGLAGIPVEYFHPVRLRAYLARLGREGISTVELLDFLEAHRSTSNGVFGAKVHLEQVKRGAKDEVGLSRFLGLFDVAILVYRRNKLLQAISYARAIQTQHWEASTAEGVEQARAADAVYSAEEIAGHLRAFIEQESEWRRALGRGKVRYAAVAYEDLVADFPARMREIVGFIGDPALAQAEFPAPPLHQLRDDITAEWAARFIGDIQGGGLTGQSAS